MYEYGSGINGSCCNSIRLNNGSSEWNYKREMNKNFKNLDYKILFYVNKIENGFLIFFNVYIVYNDFKICIMGSRCKICKNLIVNNAFNIILCLIIIINIHHIHDDVYQWYLRHEY